MKRIRPTLAGIALLCTGALAGGVVGTRWQAWQGLAFFGFTATARADDTYFARGLSQMRHDPLADAEGAIPGIVLALQACALGTGWWTCPCRRGFRAGG